MTPERWSWLNRKSDNITDTCKPLGEAVLQVYQDTADIRSRFCPALRGELQLSFQPLVAYTLSPALLRTVCEAMTQEQKIARAICRLATNGDCVMDEKPRRAECTFGDCRMMMIAKEAIQKARLLK